MENHFGKRTAWSLLYFLNYAYLVILPIRKFWESVSNTISFSAAQQPRPTVTTEGVFFLFHQNFTAMGPIFRTFEKKIDFFFLFLFSFFFFFNGDTGKQALTLICQRFFQFSTNCIEIFSQCFFF